MSLPRPDRSKLAFGYLRLSKIEQEKLDKSGAQTAVSLDVQRETIERYCQAHGLKLVGLFIDPGVSGALAIEERPKGAELVRQLEHKDARGCHLVAARFDRLFRDASDALNTLRVWEKLPINLHLCDMPVPDLSSPMGRLIMGVFALMAQLERDMIAERTRLVLEHKKRMGELYGTIPYGMRLVKGTKDLEVDPLGMAALGRIHELLSEGRSYRQTTAIMDHEKWPTANGGPWATSTLARLKKRLAEEPGLVERALRYLRDEQLRRAVQRESDAKALEESLRAREAALAGGKRDDDDGERPR